jgi:hypothetical protein
MRQFAEVLHLSIPTPQHVQLPRPTKRNLPLPRGKTPREG